MQDDSFVEHCVQQVHLHERHYPRPDSRRYEIVVRSKYILMQAWIKNVNAILDQIRKKKDQQA